MDILEEAAERKFKKIIVLGVVDREDNKGERVDMLAEGVSHTEILGIFERMRWSICLNERLLSDKELVLDKLKRD